jgi:hypothetical protein
MALRLALAAKESASTGRVVNKLGNP